MDSSLFRKLSREPVPGNRILRRMGHRDNYGEGIIAFTRVDFGLSARELTEVTA